MKSTNQATVDGLNQQIEDTKKKVPTSEELDVLVADRAAFVDTVKSIGSEVDIAGKTEAEAKKLIVADKCTDITDIESKDESYINARFDVLAKAAKDGGVDDILKESLFSKDSKEGGTPKLSPSEKARKAMVERNKKMYLGDQKQD